MRLYDEVEIAGAYKELGYSEFAGKESGVYFACEGREDLADLEAKVVHEACKALGGIERPGLGERWWRKRFDTAYLKKAYMLPNGIGDAIECASTYKNLTAMHDAMVAAIKEQGAHEVFGHGSHFYPTGGNLYIIWSAFAERDGNRVCTGIMDAAMSRHFGWHHRPSPRYRRQQGSWIHLDAPTMWPVVQKIKAALDPYGIMNPGKLGL
jgi:alkyldihydroxyacetonephosphate synthase